MKTSFHHVKLWTGSLLSTLVILVFGSKVLVLSSCANMIPPSGGPRDSIPPLLQKVSPPDSSKRFTNKTITFTFDEYVELAEVQKNVLISPNPETNPEINYKLKEVTVKFEDSLEANTTYSIQFGNAIQDINERNILRNFSYIFTTGDYFDSLEFNGNVILAETGGIDTTLYVMLHRSADDSAVVNKKPRYLTKVDKQGNFRFRALSPGTYYVYALKDDNAVGKYFSTEQLFAFADSPMVVSADTVAPVTLYAYSVKRPPEPGTSAGFDPGAGTRPNEVARLRFGTSLSGGVQDLLEPFSLSFTTPLKNFDSTQLFVSTDTSFLPVPAVAWQLDSTRTKATLTTPLREDTRYNLVLKKEFATDSLGLQLLKADTLSFQTRRQSEYGQVRVRLTKVDTTEHPVLLIQQGGRLIKSASLEKGEFFAPLFLPGSYELFILYDRNKNGKWDPGEFFGKHLQPERVKPIKRKLDVRADWENEIDIE